MPSSENPAINRFRLTTEPEHSDGRRPVLVDGRGTVWPLDMGVSMQVVVIASTHERLVSVPPPIARDLVRYWLDHSPREGNWTEDEREMMAAYLEQRPVKRQAPASE